MGESITIASPDAQYGAWLQQCLGALRPYATVKYKSADQTQAPPTNNDDADADLRVLHLFCNESADGNGEEDLAAVRKLRAEHNDAAIVVIAESGDELRAIGTLRVGADDYLPRRLVTPARLEDSLRLAQRAAEHRAATARRLRPKDSLDDTASVDVVIPGYQILRTLGRSTRAVVYLAATEERDHDIALKVSELGGDEDDRLQQQLSREYQAIADIDDPAVIDIYDYGVHAGREYLAMEYFPGGDLHTRMQHPLSVAAALWYGKHIAAALHVVHSRGIVHRDLKPQNIMLRPSDEIVLIDFGLAKSDNSTRNTSTGALVGSPYFMSPEQAQGLTVDARTDLYSLGVILYEMWTQRKPFYGRSAIEVLQHHVTTAPAPLPDSLQLYQPLIDKLLAKKPEDRFQSATEVTEALAAH